MNLQSGMVFEDTDGDLVLLDRPVAGDAHQWFVAVRWGESWAYMDDIVEATNLVERRGDMEPADSLQG